MNSDELTISEINRDEVNTKAKEFIETVEMNEDGSGNGIYVFQAGDDRYYLFLSQEYLTNGTYFDEVEVKVENGSLSIYLKDRAKQDADNIMQKVYEMNAMGEYEFLRVFKNGEETTIETFGG